MLLPDFHPHNMFKECARPISWQRRYSNYDPISWQKRYSNYETRSQLSIRSCPSSPVLFFGGGLGEDRKAFLKCPLLVFPLGDWGTLLFISQKRGEHQNEDRLQVFNYYNQQLNFSQSKKSVFQYSIIISMSAKLFPPQIQT